MGKKFERKIRDLIISENEINKISGTCHKRGYCSQKKKRIFGRVVEETRENIDRYSSFTTRVPD
jgi:hypothetical protein